MLRLPLRSSLASISSWCCLTTATLRGIASSQTSSLDRRVWTSIVQRFSHKLFSGPVSDARGLQLLDLGEAPGAGFISVRRMHQITPWQAYISFVKRFEPVMLPESEMVLTRYYQVN